MLVSIRIMPVMMITRTIIFTIRIGCTPFRGTHDLTACRLQYLLGLYRMRNKNARYLIFSGGGGIISDNRKAPRE